MCIRDRYYYEGQDKLILSDNFLYYDRNGEIRGKAPYFTTVTAEGGRYLLEGTVKADLGGGMLNDGKDAYVFLEKATVTYNGKTKEIAPQRCIRDRNRDILSVTMDGQERLFEVSDVNGSLISCIPLTSVIGLKKGLTVVKKSESLDILYNDNILGRVFNSYGEPIDNQPEGEGTRRSIYSRNPVSYTHLNICEQRLHRSTGRCDEELRGRRRQLLLLCSIQWRYEDADQTDRGRRSECAEIRQWTFHDTWTGRR